MQTDVGQELTSSSEALTSRRSPGSPSLSREWTAVVIVLAAALLYKIVYLTFYAQQMPFFSHPLGDSAVYLDWANRIAHGDFWGLQEPFKVFYRAPLYPYLMAISIWIFGSSSLPIYLFQILLGTFNLFLTYVLARRLFSHRAGIAAMALAALYAPLTFEESKLVSVTLVITLVLVGAWLLLTVLGPGSAGGNTGSTTSKRAGGRLFLAGICFGLATIAWGGMIAVVLLLVVFWLFRAVRATLPEPKHAFRSLVLVLVGWFLMILPVTLHNLLVGNDLVLVNSNSGYTFYQGNNLAASGGIVQPPEVYERAYGGRFPTGIAEQQSFDQGYASMKLYPAQQGKAQQIAKPSEASGFWLKRGLGWIAKNPGQYLRLEFQKLVMTLSNIEFAGNYYLSVELDQVPILRVLFLPFAIIFALGIAGLLFPARAGPGGPTGRTAWPLHLVMVTTVLTLLIFYVGTRYRLPLILPLAVFAGKAADDLIQHWRRRQIGFAQLSVIVVALVVSWVLCTVPLTGRNRFITALGFRNLGEAYTVQAGNPVKGEAALRKGLAVFGTSSAYGGGELARNSESELHLLLGNALLDQQKHDSAIAEFRSVLGIDPRMTDAESRLALAFYTKALRSAPQGQTPSRALLDTARSYAGQYRQSDTMSTAANSLLGDIFLARQDRDSALAAYRQILQVDSLFVPVLLAMADVELAQGDTARSLSDLRRAVGVDSLNLVPILKLGLTYGIQGNHNAVRAMLGAAVERFERNPKLMQAMLRSPAFSNYIDTKFYYAVAALNLHEWDLAARQAEEIIKLAPDHQGARQLLQNARNRVVPGTR